MTDTLTVDQVPTILDSAVRKSNFRGITRWSFLKQRRRVTGLSFLRDYPPMWPGKWDTWRLASMDS